MVTFLAISKIIIPFQMIFRDESSTALTFTFTILV
nr:MAG TPA: hypothetical protein [Caudoviricetes sp.]